jgi:chemotaxis signal transduction protein
MEMTANADQIDRAHSKCEYLAFVLGAEHYVVDILQVQEIRSYETFSNEEENS